MRLRPNEFNTRPHRRHVGDVASLASRLPKFSGIAVAHQPGVGYVLLGGERRFAAHLRRNDREIEAYLLSTWKQWVAWMAHDELLAARHGFERARMDAVTAAHLDGKAQALLTFDRADRPSYDIAEYAKLPEKYVSQTRLLIRAMEEPGTPEPILAAIREQLIEVAEGRISPHAAYDRVHRQRRQLNAPKRTAAEQAKILTNVQPVLSGITDALASLGDMIDPAMPKVEAEEYVKVLLSGRSALDRAVRNLRAVVRDESGEATS